jgi:hypothetical protein
MRVSTSSGPTARQAASKSKLWSPIASTSSRLSLPSGRPSTQTMCSTLPPAAATRSAKAASQITTRFSALENRWAIWSGARVL